MGATCTNDCTFILLLKLSDMQWKKQSPLRWLYWLNLLAVLLIVGIMAMLQWDLIRRLFD
jgi:hypothetical protein